LVLAQILLVGVQSRRIGMGFGIDDGGDGLAGIHGMRS
jgi:hypothetical protein